MDTYPPRGEPPPRGEGRTILIALWLRTLVLWTHLAGVVVWFGAIAYFLLILRPAVRASEMERRQWYLLLRQIKRRLRMVIGTALTATVASGLVLASWGGLLRWDFWSIGPYGQAFLFKLLLVGILISIYLTALPVIARIEGSARRGQAFVWTHIAALVIGSMAAFLGLLLHG